MEFFALIAVCVFMILLIRSILEFFQNEASPELTQTAVLRKKRRHTTNNNGTMSTTFTAEFDIKETGESIRCHIPRRVWKELEENTLGLLTHQGTRFRRFEWNGQSVEK